MSEHLPECDRHLANGSKDCICPYLRSCEERVLDDDVLAASYHGQKGYEVGYRKGLDVARKAVAALDACPECSVDAALAAINALKETP